MHRVSWAHALLMAVTLATPTEAAAPAIRSVTSLVYGPSLLDTFRRPLGLDTDPGRSFAVVVDSGNGRLVVFDEAGRSRGSLNLRDERHASEFGEISDIAVDARGRIFVPNAVEDVIDVLNPRGARLGRVALEIPGVAPGTTHPKALDLLPDGRLVVLCGGDVTGWIVVDPFGAVSTQVGFETGEDRTYSGPIAVAADLSGERIAVIDPSAEYQVLVYSVDGKLLTRTGEHGEGEGTFSVAVGATWDANGNLWVTDTVRHSISVLSASGTVLGRVGGYGDAPGQFYYPAACAFLADGRLMVLERAGARLQVLEVDVPGVDDSASHLGMIGSGISGALLATTQGRN